MSHEAGDGDDALVRAFQAGDARGFDGLFRRYQRPIFNYVYRMTGDLAVSEDLTQETFLRVFTALGRAGELENYRAWLYRIATNVSISHLRKGRHRAASLDEMQDEAPRLEPAGPVALEPEDRQATREALEEAARALRRLSDSHRQVLVLRQLQGLSYQEIGAVMGLSVEAVTSLLHRARRPIGIGVRWWPDVLFVITWPSNLVEIRLHRPRSFRLLRLIPLPRVRTVVLNVDEPDRLVAALRERVAWAARRSE